MSTQVKTVVDIAPPVSRVASSPPSKLNSMVTLVIVLLSVVLLFLIITLFLPLGVQNRLFRPCIDDTDSFSYIDVGLYKTRHSIYRKEVYSRHICIPRAAAHVATAVTSVTPSTASMQLSVDKAHILPRSPPKVNFVLNALSSPSASASEEEDGDSFQDREMRTVTRHLLCADRVPSASSRCPTDDSMSKSDTAIHRPPLSCSLCRQSMGLHLTPMSISPTHV